MLIIVTGLPGAGKTLYTLSKVLPQFRGRKIFVSGIPSIDHDHFGTQDLEHPAQWYELPEASVAVIDEAQRIFPVRRAGTEVPRKCSEFETHRHRGLDIVLLTQDATTLDVHIRKLAGKHIHVHRLFGGHSANIYEYAEFQREPADAKTRKLALATKTFSYPKEVFEHYKSADAHTVKRQVPAKLFMLPILALAVLSALGWAGYNLYSLMGSKDEIFVDEPMVKSAQAVQDPDAPAALVHQSAFLPAVEGLPWTAPAYHQVRKVKTFPKPHCIIVHDSPFEHRAKCLCYTQQMTRMTGVPAQVCKDIARNGWFDYSLQDGRDKARQRQAGRPTPNQSTLADSRY